MNCNRCGVQLGKHYWGDVPGAGNLCPTCHEAWLKQGQPETPLGPMATPDTAKPDPEPTIPRSDGNPP